MKKIPNLEQLLNLKDINESIIEIDNFICELCEYGEEFDKLTKHQKIFYLNQNLEREVNNGGFNQYFCNSSGENAHETILSLNKIGAEKTANILQKAVHQFPNGTVPKNRDERIEIVKKIEEVVDEIWDDLTQKFFAYEDDLNTLNYGYIKKNKDFF